MNLQLPSYIQLCRRQAWLNQQLLTKSTASLNQQGLYIAVDSKGLMATGPPARWKVGQNGFSERRTWRKVHLSYDESTHQILAIVLIGNNIDDTSILKPLLDEISLPINKVSADGAYDQLRETLVHQRNHTVLASKTIGEHHRKNRWDTTDEVWPKLPCSA